MRLTSRLAMSSAWPGSVSNPIADLFALGEPGVWYDPSDLSTMFQDRAGTTPVTAPGQSVGLRLDKSKGLVLGPELVTNGAFDTDTGWTKGIGWAISGGVASCDGSQTTFSNLNQLGWTVAGKFYTYSADITVSAGFVTLYVGGATTVLNVSSSRTITGIVVAGNTNGAQVQANADFVGTIDNISIRELPGFHAVANSDAARGIYGIEPLGGRRNLLTYTEQFDNAAWGKMNAGVGVSPVLTPGFTDPDGGNTAWRLQLNAGANGASDYSLIRQSNSSWPDTGTRSIWLRSNTGSNQTVTLVATASIFRVTVTPTWQRFESASSATAKQLDVSVGGTGSTDATADILIWRPQFEAAATATPYQRVVSQYEVTEAGKPTLHYVQYDGVDDSYVTPTITPSTDKVQVFAGLRKLSDATAAIIAEMGTTGGQNGVFTVVAPGSTNQYAFSSRGTLSGVAQITSGYAAPITNIFTGFGDISGDLATLRVNGTQVAQSTADQGTGNYLAYPLYIGRRGGTSLPFNGRDYGLIVRFGSNLDAATISKIEKIIANRTGVTL